MTERTFETGGEVLHVGDTVIVFDGNSQKECPVTEIGTKRIFIDSPYGFKPVPYSKETRVVLQGAYHSYFKTKTEVADDQRRAVLKAQLKDLGLMPTIAGGGNDGLSVYPTIVLEQLVEYMTDQAEKANSGQGERG